MYEVIDNFLPENTHLEIKETLIGTSSKFPWYFNHSKSGEDLSFSNSTKYNFQFTHRFYADFIPQSNYFNLILPFLELLNPTALIRVKANLTPCTDNLITYHYHVDIPPASNTKTAIYYVNTNNGRTVFKDRTYSNSIENRLVIFDSRSYHAGTSCTDEKVRCVINFNYIK